MLEVVLVVLVAGVAGGVGLPVGFALGLAPVTTYLATTLGAIAGTVLFLAAGARLRDRVGLGQPRWLSAERTRSLSTRGPVALGLIGPTFPGIAATTAIGLTARLDRRRLALWMAIGCAALYAVYAVALSLVL